jgi:hypothetical protein
MPRKYLNHDVVGDLPHGPHSESALKKLRGDHPFSQRTSRHQLDCLPTTSIRNQLLNCLVGSVSNGMVRSLPWHKSAIWFLPSRAFMRLSCQIRAEAVRDCVGEDGTPFPALLH